MTKEFRKEHIPYIRDAYGIEFPGAMDVRQPALEQRWARSGFAADAAPTYTSQSPLVTVSNAGIPAYLCNYLDPELVRVLTAPLKAEEIFPSKKYGDWTMLTAQFPIIESTGEVSSYGDYSNDGQVNVNADFVPRQSYLFQTFTRWGDLQLDRMGLAKIDYAAEQNLASAKIINVALNKSWFFGFTGLDNYGILNDPSLTPNLTPGSKAAGGYTWAVATGQEIYNDIQSLLNQLILQTNGQFTMDEEMLLCMSPQLQPTMLRPMVTSTSSVYGATTVEDYLKRAMPKLRVIAAPEYATSSGQLVQLIAPEVQGQKTGWTGYTERMRAHAIVRETSATHQKKSAGSWGAIIKFPGGIASMIGL